MDELHNYSAERGEKKAGYRKNPHNMIYFTQSSKTCMTLHLGICMYVTKLWGKEKTYIYIYKIPEMGL